MCEHGCCNRNFFNNLGEGPGNDIWCEDELNTQKDTASDADGNNKSTKNWQ